MNEKGVQGGYVTATSEPEQYWEGPDYVMIAVEDEGVLQDAVNEILEEGYTLYGQPFAAGSKICQALVLGRSTWRLTTDFENGLNGLEGSRE